MKIGIECEGLLRGFKTLFCDAEAFTRGAATATSRDLPHLYVSDNQNTIPYDHPLLGSFKGIVTLDVTQVRNEPRPSNLALMLRLPGYDEVAKLQRLDQVKFEADRHVLVAPIGSFIKTVPSDFDGDIEI